MTVNEIGTFISQYGFPIVACCAMFWQNIQQTKRHAEEAKKWASVLNSNTLALERLEHAIDSLRIDALKNDIPGNV